MKVTLQVNGQEMTFSEEELVSILKEYFRGKEATKKTKEPEKERVAIGEEIFKGIKILKKAPDNQYWCNVYPLAIDQTLFENKRDDPEQERTRKLILEAFAMLKKNPKYERHFVASTPEEIWISKTAKKLKEKASQVGDHNANWVEQALEWAQRICYGETWEDICNNPDTASYYRLVVWKKGAYRLIGGSKECGDTSAPSYLGVNFNSANNQTQFAVPLVVSYYDEVY